MQISSNVVNGPKGNK